MTLAKALGNAIVALNTVLKCGDGDWADHKTCLWCGRDLDENRRCRSDDCPRRELLSTIGVLTKHKGDLI